MVIALIILVDNTPNTVDSHALPLLQRVLQPLKPLRERLKARTDSEHEQAILRIVIVSLVLVLMGFMYSSEGAGRGELAFGLGADLILAVALFVGICFWPAPSIPRRITGMLADAGAATFVMFLTGESGVSMIGVYLFITLGNG